MQSCARTSPRRTGRLHAGAENWPSSRPCWRCPAAAFAQAPAARAATAAGFLQGRDQDHRSRRQRLHARRPGRQHHGGGGEGRHHHGGRRVRAAARQDQGRDRCASRTSRSNISINTHYHGDHTGGNEAFAKDGVTVVAQDNVKKRLAAGTTNGLTGAKTPPAPPDALPAEDLYRLLQDQAARAASPTSSTSPTPIPTATPMSGSRPPTCWRPATPSPTAAIPISTSPMAATSRA